MTGTQTAASAGTSTLMQKSDRILVLRAGCPKPILVRAENVTPDDLILEGDMRLLNHADAVRGRKRTPIRTDVPFEVRSLVYVRRMVRAGDAEVPRSMWVAGDNVKPDDTVLVNAHNVRPYRYDSLKPAKPKKRGTQPFRGTMHLRRASKLFGELERLAKTTS